MKSIRITIRTKVIEQYFPVVLFIMLFKVVLTSENVAKILKCNHSIKQRSPTMLFVSIFQAFESFLNL